MARRFPARSSAVAAVSTSSRSSAGIAAIGSTDSSRSGGSGGVSRAPQTGQLATCRTSEADVCGDSGHDSVSAETLGQSFQWFCAMRTRAARR